MSRGPAGLHLREAARHPGGRAGAIAVALVAGAAVFAGCPKKSLDDDPSVRAVRTQMGYIETQIQVFASEHRRAPTPQEGLAVLFDGVMPKDPWGNEVQYEVPGPNNLAFDLISYGADGAPGGKKEDADLRWSELKK